MKNFLLKLYYPIFSFIVLPIKLYICIRTNNESELTKLSIQSIKMSRVMFGNKRVDEFIKKFGRKYEAHH